MNTYIPEISDIKTAHEKIKPHINRTPVFTSSSVDDILGAKLFLKCENFQKVGAFKFRGATNAVLSLSEEEISNGVATHSSGNHAAALARAASIKRTPAHIVMPENAPEIKKKAVAGYGGIITYCKPTLEARETTLQKIVDRTDACFIHPYDDSRIVAGQGTAAVELIEESGNLDIVMAPVGGGGLLSGTSISSKALLPSAEVIAAEPERADDAYRSFKSGNFIPSVNPDTIADGLLTSLSELTFGIIKKNVDDIVTVTEDSIKKAMRMIWERMKIIIEPSSAVPIAAIMENRERFKGKRVGIIISGGNVDLDKLRYIL